MIVGKNTLDHPFLFIYSSFWHFSFSVCFMYTYVYIMHTRHYFSNAYIYIYLQIYECMEKVSSETFYWWDLQLKKPECTGLWVRFGSPNAHPHHSVSRALRILSVIHPSSDLLLSWFTDLISYGDTDTFQLNLFPESFLPTSSPSYCLCLRPRLWPLNSRYFRNILLLKVVNSIAQYLYNPWIFIFLTSREN